MTSQTYNAPHPAIDQSKLASMVEAYRATGNNMPSVQIKVFLSDQQVSALKRWEREVSGREDDWRDLLAGMALSRLNDRLAKELAHARK